MKNKRTPYTREELLSIWFAMNWKEAAERHGLTKQQVHSVWDGNAGSWATAGLDKPIRTRTRKLDETQVRAIRASDETNTALSTFYGVSRQQIRRIRLREHWKNI